MIGDVKIPPTWATEPAATELFRGPLSQNADGTPLLKTDGQHLALIPVTPEIAARIAAIPLGTSAVVTGQQALLPDRGSKHYSGPAIRVQSVEPEEGAGQVKRLEGELMRLSGGQGRPHGVYLRLSQNVTIGDGRFSMVLVPSEPPAEFFSGPVVARGRAVVDSGPGGQRYARFDGPVSYQLCATDTFSHGDADRYR